MTYEWAIVIVGALGSFAWMCSAAMMSAQRRYEFDREFEYRQKAVGDIKRAYSGGSGSGGAASVATNWPLTISPPTKTKN